MPGGQVSVYSFTWVRRPVRNKSPNGEANRAKLLEVVREEPGISLRELGRKAGVPTGTLSHHTAILVREGKLEEARVACKRVFRLPGVSTAWPTLKVMREEGMTSLVAKVRELGQPHQAAVIEAMAWERSTTQNRLDRLVRYGVLRTRVQGRFTLYEVAA